jgi:hypothetical protein
VPKLTLDILDGSLTVARLDAEAGIPEWLDWNGKPLVSVTRTRDELSVIAPSDAVPGHVTSERGWRALKVQGVLDFALTGILASLATSLARAGVSVFAVSTFDTDYLLVKEASLRKAAQALAVEHTVNGAY